MNSGTQVLCLRALLSSPLITASFKLSNFAICGSSCCCCFRCICLDDHGSVKQDEHRELIQSVTNDVLWPVFATAVAFCVVLLETSVSKAGAEISN